MWKFGIYADSDSFFVGGKPGRWIGLHVDHPWSEDCKLFDAPYRAYVHYWPGKCWSFDLPIPDKRPNIFITASGGRRTLLVKRCSVEGCTVEGEQVHFGLTIYTALNRRGGIRTAKEDRGGTHALLCPTHADLAAADRLRIKLVER